MQRTREPVTRCWISAEFVLFTTRHTSRCISPMNPRTCSNAIRACPKLDATMTTSPRRAAIGPSRAAHAIAPTSVVFPFPLAIDSAAEDRPGASAPLRNRLSQGSTRIGSPAPAPCVISSPPMYRSTAVARLSSPPPRWNA